MSHPKTAIVILAAGKSARLGRPKQLVEYGNSNLLQHTIDVASSSTATEVFVILGSEFEKIKSNIHLERINILLNSKWEEGLSTSIQCGVKEIMVNWPSLDHILFMVSDQPYVNVKLVEDILFTCETSQLPIVASRYNDTYGIPALFHKSLFTELLELTGDVGAGKLIRKHIQQTAFVDFAKGGMDIDTREDLEKIR